MRQQYKTGKTQAEKKPTFSMDKQNPTKVEDIL